jgi:hypothetical protein
MFATQAETWEQRKGSRPQLRGQKPGGPETIALIKWHRQKVAKSQFTQPSDAALPATDLEVSTRNPYLLIIDKFTAVYIQAVVS